MAKKKAAKKSVGVLIPIAKKGKTEPERIVSFIQLRESKTMAGPINKQRCTGVKHYWVTIGQNGECLSTSETYETLQKCKQTAYQIADQLAVPVKFFKRIAKK